MKTVCIIGGDDGSGREAMLKAIATTAPTTFAQTAFKDCYFCNTYVVTPLHIADINFIGVYDSPKSLNNAIKNLREFITKNI